MQVYRKHSSYSVKCVRIRSFSGPYFPTFGLNTDQKNSRPFSRSNNVDYSSKALLIPQARIVAGAAADKLSLLLSYKAKMLADIFSD